MLKFKIQVLVTTLILLLILIADLFAQGLPGLPGEPEQAPIDGGLGILAALGGAYAIKKLRNRQ